jgi:hypothetical protein
MTRQTDSHNRLERSPIANISLASKELFHSNFLAWIFNTYPTMLNAVLDNARLPKRLSDESVIVTREEQNFDLVAKIGDTRLLIIENKLKSLPSIEQLNRYQEKAEKLDSRRKSPELVLLTLTPEDSRRIPSLPESWKPLDYGTLARVLRDCIPADADSYHADIIKDYTHFVAELVRVANDESRHVWRRAGSSINGEDLPTWLTKHKLHDLFGKRQGQIVAANVYEQLRKEFGDRIRWQQPPKSLRPSEITVYSGFSNSQALVGVFCALSNLRCQVDDAPPVGVGFQVQGNQFRSYVEWPKPGLLARRFKERELPSITAAIAWDLFCDTRCPQSFWAPGRKSGPKHDTGERKSRRYKDQCRFGAQFQYRYEALLERKDQQLTLDLLAEKLTHSVSSLLGDLELIESLLRYYEAKCAGKTEA